jgi:signal transduction histidine kinase
MNSHIRDIYKEGGKRLWLVTEGGLSCFDVTKESFTNFTTKDGLPVRSPTSHFYYDPVQGVLFNGGKGIVFSFHPERINKSPRPPKTIITSVLVNGKDYSFTTAGAKLKPDQNDITINYTAIDLANGPSTNYEYKLVGEDTGWMNVGTMRQINLSHLAPGSYTFVVRASNRDGEWNDQTSSFHFTIRTPFTKSAAFYILLLLLMGAIFYAMFRFRLRQLKKAEQIRSEISRNLHDEVGSTLTNISLGSLLAQKELKNEQEVNQILQRIYQDSQHVSESMREIVWSINPKIRTMGEATSRMLHYASEIMDARDIELGVSMSPEIEELKLDMPQRRDLYLIFKEAVNNLAKYSNATKAMIRFELQGRTLVMTVSDNGKGFDITRSHSGDGLKNMQDRAHRHHWQLSIDSASGKGTTIRLRTPMT